MTTNIQLAIAPSADTSSACVYLRSDRCHYVFGRVPEGSQRTMGSRKVAFAGVTQIFLSGATGWDQVGGLMGFMLTIAGAANSSKEGYRIDNLVRQGQGKRLLEAARHQGVDVHGGDNLSHLMASQRSVLLRQSINARIHEQRTDTRESNKPLTEPDWHDDVVRVWKVPVTRERSSSPRKRRRTNGPESDDKADVTDADMEKLEAENANSAEVARYIVEKQIWNGDVRFNPLEACRIRDLTPSDDACVIENGMPRLYKGPYTTDGMEPPKAGDKAWIWRHGDIGPRRSNVETMSSDRIPLRTSYSQISMSYIVKMRDRRGKFDPKAAKALGVQVTDFKRLTAGQTVTTADGKEVTPDMVMGEPIRGRGLIVADIESPDFVESFMQRPEWEDQELMSHISVMYWLLGADLSTHPRIRKFMDDRPQIRHVVCAPDTCPNMICNPGPAELQMRLRRLDPDRFAVLKYDNAVKTQAPPPKSNIEFGRIGRSAQLMPKLLFEDDKAAPFADLMGAYNSVADNVLALARKCKAQATDPDFLAKIEKEEKDIPGRDTEITCLGTGSSVPSKYRNVSGTLVRVPGKAAFLLDCGEGTLGQINRLWGYDGAAEVLRDLRCILISHLHADHHLGTTSIIKAWYEQTLRDGSNAKLAISCVPKFRSILQDYAQVEDFGFHRLVFPNCEDEASFTYAQAGLHFSHDHGLKAIRRVPVPHCPRSEAVEIELASGLRVAYSGDCRPSQAFAKACRGTHLLIHESTFGDDKADHAKQKMHSTMGEALQVAKDMQARRTLLTHFSQRYVKREALKWEGEAGAGSVLLGFDYMTVRVGDWQKAACYMPALEKLFQEDGEEPDDSTES
ncbi:beta-lactamase-like protein [Emericellopsis atlantica]|uniref:ribonuclease Z n=1 Tax=Emericellopsis atlantica TaxID=2614577 RepID=A0A9P7ZSR6_9HYPO|nr:beta-lactamase-like protein [Emericellopsis atlantica]KAG9257117.1 beta-lactamase-like protein [Emericellopsis atlantica]